VYFTARSKIKDGDFVYVKIDRVIDYDLFGGAK